MMADFLKSLTLFQQIVMAIVAPATVILLLQFVMLLFGLSGHDTDAGTDTDTDTDIDTDTDTDTDTGIDISDGHFADTASGVDAGEDTGGAFGHTAVHPETHDTAEQNAGVIGMLGGLKLFTFRGILAFLAIGGWTALLVSLTDSVFWAVVAGFLAGAFADIMYGLMIKSMSKLSESGNIDIRNAVGRTGEVYIPIPPNREGTGKVSIELQGRLCELEAVTDGPEALKTGRKIVVLGVAGNSLLAAPEE